MATELEELGVENVRLRAALAQSELPCAYCSLPRDKWAKCASGFPGCARADDAAGCPHLGASLELDGLRARIAELESQVPRWRDPAVELPPIGERPVLIECDDRGRAVVLRAIYVHPNRLEADVEYGLEDAEYYEANDTYYCSSGWYEVRDYGSVDCFAWSIGSVKVTGWMPLPEVRK